MAQVRRAWKPPARLTLSEWADDCAVLSTESAAEVGKWRTLPYQRGIMDAITDRHIESVTVMKSARVGWSKILNHTIGYHAHHEPCPLMLVQPTIGDAEGYSKDEIAPMIRDTPVLEAIFPLPGTRDAGNTILRKAFPGGVLMLIGADSPRGFRRVSVRVVMFDEVDGYSATAGEEGDQLKLGIKRTEYFWNRKILAGSTPTLDQTSRIKRRFEAGDQRHYFVPCPHCDHKQQLVWENLRWPKGEPEKAAFVCVEGCGAEIGYEHQRWMIEEADRRQRAGEPGIGWVATNPDAEPGHASFHIWAAYSYAPNATWGQLAREWVSSHRNIEERKTFMNTVLGLPYKGQGDAPDWKRLYDRRERYQIGWVTGDGLILFAGVDVQKDRIEVEIVAYGPDMRSWSVAYRVFPGDTSQLDGKDSPYRALDALLAEWFPREGGGALQIRMLAIDAGYNTNTVYQWVRRHAANRVIAVDGRDSYAMIIGQPKAVEVTERGKRKSRAVKLWPIGTSMAKTELYGWLKQEKPTDESGDDLPFGYCSFPEYPDEYFKQLTAEEVVPRLVRGFRRYQWEKVYGRNEALDCRVYARAAAALVGIDRWTAAQWDTLRNELDTKKPARGAAPAVPRKPRITKVDDPYL
ncbi:phage terminase large subunit family protein [Lysobacter sp. LF1]|uniref:Phage terminase large subunit family protein n=1 Tax=Lysobacter stagni TaxID=3045172 RepID=A0ABT6XKQ5_9GAMM|nr:phage terminase large subunit family protein [Lysobacter sp. LF1]MDI9240748.1 phage terminase large subunit family protein [Lysobacter sp. LF1]